MAPTEVTREIFKMHGVPYQSSTDPVEAWNFPDEFRETFVKLYPNLRGANETRIEFCVRWFKQKLLQLNKLHDDLKTSYDQRILIRNRVRAYESTLHGLCDKLKELHQLRVTKQLSEIPVHFAPPQEVIEKPPVVVTFIPPPKISTANVTVLPAPEEINPQFLIDREFYAGLPRYPSYCHEEAAYKKAYTERKNEFAAEGKYPFTFDCWG